jgi:hypothetical protein
MKKTLVTLLATFVLAGCNSEQTSTDAKQPDLPDIENPIIPDISHPIEPAPELPILPEPEVPEIALPVEHCSIYNHYRENSSHDTKDQQMLNNECNTFVERRLVLLDDEYITQRLIFTDVNNRKESHYFRYSQNDVYGTNYDYTTMRKITTPVGKELDLSFLEASYESDGSTVTITKFRRDEYGDITETDIVLIYETELGFQEWKTLLTTRTHNLAADEAILFSEQFTSMAKR